MMYLGQNPVGINSMHVDPGLEQEVSNLQNIIAPGYDDLTFPVSAGQHCIQNGSLYVANQAIASSEDWTAAHWTEVVLTEELSSCGIQDVRVNGTSVTSNGVANVPMTGESALGVAKVSATYGTGVRSDGTLQVVPASDAQIKGGTGERRPVAPYQQHQAVFYGLAKAAGDSTQASSDNAVGTYTSDAKAAIQTMLGVPGDVQVNGTSVVSNGVASIPMADTSNYGAVKINTDYGISYQSGCICVRNASESLCKSGTNIWRPITPSIEHVATFYGLASASGDTTQSSSSNAVGVYTNDAKVKIQEMLGIEVGTTLIETVSGTTPTITAQPNVRYNCGEVSTITITPPASGTCDVFFTSGTTAAILTVPSTVKFPSWFDDTSLAANTIYEIMITDGVYGSVVTWAS